MTFAPGTADVISRCQQVLRRRRDAHKQQTWWWRHLPRLQYKSTVPLPQASSIGLPRAGPFATQGLVSFRIPFPRNHGIPHFDADTFSSESQMTHAEALIRSDTKQDFGSRMEQSRDSHSVGTGSTVVPYQQSAPRPHRLRRILATGSRALHKGAPLSPHRLQQAQLRLQDTMDKSRNSSGVVSDYGTITRSIRIEANSQRASKAKAGVAVLLEPHPLAFSTQAARCG